MGLKFQRPQMPSDKRWQKHLKKQQLAAQQKKPKKVLAKDTKLVYHETSFGKPSIYKWHTLSK